MTQLQDWQNFTEFEQEHFVDTEFSYNGPASLRIKELDKQTEASVYKPSMSTEAASSQARATTWIRRTRYAFLGMYLRFEDLGNNYFVIGGWFNGDKKAVRLYRTESGNTELVHSIDGIESFSDGTAVIADPSWIPFRVTWFTDDMNGFRVWIQEDADGDGEWDDVGGTLVDPDPILGPKSSTTGSGIGFGSINRDRMIDGIRRARGEQAAGVWYDQTKLFYEQ
jgi:hypothetical protein